MSPLTLAGRRLGTISPAKCALAFLFLTAATSAQPYAYVSASALSRVQVVNLCSEQIVASLPMQGFPLGVALTPDNSKAYVGSQLGFHTVASINTATNIVSTFISAGGSFPWGITVNPSGTRAYVVLNGSDRVSVIDTATDSIIASHNLDTPFWADSMTGIAIDPAGSKLFVTHFGWAGTYYHVSIVDAASLETATPLVTGLDLPAHGPLGIAVHPTLPFAYVAMMGEAAPQPNPVPGNSVLILDLSTPTPSVAGSIVTGARPVSVRFSPDGTRAYVTNRGDNTVAVIDTATHTVVGLIPTGPGPFGIDLTADGRWGYVGNEGGDTLSILNLTNNTNVGQIVTGLWNTSFGHFVTTHEPPASGCVRLTPSAITVSVDIKPGSYPNSINLGANGVVPVAILGSQTFNAATVNPATITVASGSVKLKGNGTLMSSMQDVNNDGYSDLVVHVEISALVLSAADTTATVEGKTFGNVSIRGSDTVRIVP